MDCRVSQSAFGPEALNTFDRGLLARHKAVLSLPSFWFHSWAPASRCIYLGPAIDYRERNGCRATFKRSLRQQAMPVDFHILLTPLQVVVGSIKEEYETYPWIQVASVKMDKLIFTLMRLGTSRAGSQLIFQERIAHLASSLPSIITLGHCMNLRPFYLCGPSH